jgi:hypothetical protein
MATLLNTKITLDGTEFRIAEEKREGSQLNLTLIPASDVVHGCPPKGSGLTTCCGMPPRELPFTDRMTIDGPVTCGTERLGETIPSTTYSRVCYALLSADGHVEELGHIGEARAREYVSASGLTLLSRTETVTEISTPWSVEKVHAAMDVTDVSALAQEFYCPNCAQWMPTSSEQTVDVHDLRWERAEHMRACPSRPA